MRLEVSVLHSGLQGGVTHNVSKRKEVRPVSHGVCGKAVPEYVRRTFYPIKASPVSQSPEELLDRVHRNVFAIRSGEEVGGGNRTYLCTAVVEVVCEMVFRQLGNEN